MSEYWVSRKKYFCKYCDIYIADDAPSRNQHESGLRHKGNKDRFVRGLYKQGERHKKDLEDEKREMVRIERAANEAHARDISSGHAAVASGSKPPVAGPSTASASRKPEKPASPFANYSTAQSLGYTDPDAERVAAEVERRRAQGVVGEWEIVAAPPASSPPSTVGNDRDESNAADGLARKREADANHDEDDSRRFKMRKKVLSAGLGEIWDPGDIPIKLKSDKVKEEAKQEEGEGGWMSRSGGHEVGQTKADPSVDKMIPGPKWTPRGWKRAGVEDVPPTPDDSVPSSQEDFVPTSNSDPMIKEQINSTSGGSEAPVVRDSPDVPRSPKAEPNDDELPGQTQISAADRGGGSLFRKRKIPASGAASRGGGTR